MQQYPVSMPKHDDRAGQSYSLMDHELTNLERVLRQNREQQLLARLIQQEQQPQINLLQSALGNEPLGESAYSIQRPFRTAGIDPETLLRISNPPVHLDLQQMLYQSGIPRLPNASLPGLLSSGFTQNRIPNPLLSQPDLLLQSLLANRQQASAWNANMAHTLPDSILAAHLDPRVLSRASYLSNSLSTLAAVNDDKIPKVNQDDDKSHRSKGDIDNDQGSSPPNKRGKIGP